ncbi:MAG: energy-coupling factor transporter transmembrane protein EcfT [Clostridia bacterium]|nr:energy-coupling factor transporter transmembrane protein EcfT [Clostridia bacterium]
MNISIGQYIPGNSLLHRADPRTKIIVTLIYMVLVILINDYVGYIFAGAFLLAELIVSRIKPKLILKSIEPVLVLLLFTAVLNILFYKGESEPLFAWKFIEIYKEGISFAIRMIIRIVLLVTGASVLTYTTTSVKLTDGLEKLMSPLTIIKFPAHEVAMMMSIALRFIPIFVEETEKIMKAQSARGSDFDTGRLGEKIRSFVPILVPLFVSAFRRADELSTAMEARCYRGGKKRTRYTVLKFTKADVAIFIVTAVLAALIIVNRYVWPFKNLVDIVKGLF